MSIEPKTIGNGPSLEWTLVVLGLAALSFVLGGVLEQVRRK